MYAIAESAYHQMRHYNENQCVIISGESGAGKTEAAKKLMDYVVHRTGRTDLAIEDEPFGESELSAQSKVIRDKVLATNPLLEAFGNAKTLRNNNSSRFGKYLELQFSRIATGQDETSTAIDPLVPVGASIKNYLLEKSRVVGQTTNERNFHVFYQFTKAVAAGHGLARRYQGLCEI